MRYGVVFWGGSSVQNELAVFRLQKRAMRILCKAKRLQSCKDLFVKHEILTFPSLYIFEVIVQTKQYLPTYLSNSDIHLHNTRHKNDLHAVHCNLSRTKKSPHNIGIELYNKLPINLKTIECIQIQILFKSSIQILFKNSTS